MAKDILFTAYDFRRREIHKIAVPPSKISTHRLRREEWLISKRKAIVPRCGKTQARKSVKSKKSSVNYPRNIGDVLRYRSAEIQCLYCRLFGDDPKCGRHCSRKFRTEHFRKDIIDIKETDQYGYGTFTAPGVHITKGEWLGEYIGELRPLDIPSDSSSLYRFEIPGICVIDSELAGNWTRFINSHCRPNVKPWGEFIGKRHVVLFQALKDIGPEEELTFSYGGKYFERAGFKCACNLFDQPHMPGSSFAKKSR